MEDIRGFLRSPTPHSRDAYRLVTCGLPTAPSGNIPFYGPTVTELYDKQNECQTDFV